MNEDAWELFATMCQVVVKEQNVFLDVICTKNTIEFMLMPMEEDDE